MPASGMGQTPGAGNGVTPSAKAVLFNPFTGQVGAPLDNDQAGNASTGALNTGIGFGIGTRNSINPGAIRQQFTDDYTPGETMPDGTVAVDARLVAIGGGRSTPDGVSDPFTAAPLGGFGNGASRDGGAGAYFAMKLVTAPAPVAHGAAIEAGFVNRVEVGYTLPQDFSAFGSATSASPLPT